MGSLESRKYLNKQDIIYVRSSNNQVLTLIRVFSKTRSRKKQVNEHLKKTEVEKHNHAVT